MRKRDNIRGRNKGEGEKKGERGGMVDEKG